MKLATRRSARLGEAARSPVSQPAVKGPGRGVARHLASGDDVLHPVGVFIVLGITLLLVVDGLSGAFLHGCMYVFSVLRFSVQNLLRALLLVKSIASLCEL